VTAVLLTHHHPDHLGCAERIRGEAQAPVLIHAADADGARRGGVSPPTLGVLRAMIRPPCARYLFSASQAGAGRVPPIAQLVTFADGERLDLPGRPRVIHTPGHTNGQCVLHLEERAVLFTGDALVTLDVGTGRIEPSLLGSPFTLDRVRAAASLERVEATRAAVLLPGHGDPWRDGVARAVQLARQPGRSPRLRGPASIPARRFRGSVRGQFATDASRQRW
jgi:glyoxylase-like metal-dependent hydrolase (beta-lactamase superfamily II)